MAGILLRKRLCWALSYFYFITFGGSVALGVYLPTLLKGHFGLSLADAGTRTAGFVSLRHPHAARGWLVLRPHRRRAPPPGCVRADYRAGAAAHLVELVVFSIGALGVAALLGLGNGAVFKLVPQYFPSEVGVVTGLVGALGGLGGFFPPIVLGVLKQTTGSYTLGFILLALFALAAFVVTLLVFVRRSTSRHPGTGVPSYRAG